MTIVKPNVIPCEIYGGTIDSGAPCMLERRRLAAEGRVGSSRRPTRRQADGHLWEEGGHTQDWGGVYLLGTILMVKM